MPRTPIEVLFSSASGQGAINARDLTVVGVSSCLGDVHMLARKLRLGSVDHDVLRISSLAVGVLYSRDSFAQDLVRCSRDDIDAVALETRERSFTLLDIALERPWFLEKCLGAHMACDEDPLAGAVRARLEDKIHEVVASSQREPASIAGMRDLGQLLVAAAAHGVIPSPSSLEMRVKVNFRAAAPDERLPQFFGWQGRRAADADPPAYETDEYPVLEAFPVIAHSPTQFAPVYASTNAAAGTLWAFMATERHGAKALQAAAARGWAVHKPHSRTGARPLLASAYSSEGHVELARALCATGEERALPDEPPKAAKAQQFAVAYAAARAQQALLDRGRAVLAPLA